MALSASELKRKVVHLGIGAVAFALRPLGPALSALGAIAAIVFNSLILPRWGGRALLRGEEASAGYALGIVLYPVTVLLLILCFWNRLEIAAAAWGILAFGDGMASVVGMTLGTRKLPWNRAKSWAGSLAYLVCGGTAATVLLQWTAPGRYPLAFALAIAFAIALAAALAESLPIRFDDNLGVPLLAGLLLFCLLSTQGGWGGLATVAFGARLLVALGINAVLATIGYLLRGVSVSGLVAGFVLGTWIYALTDWRGYLLLLAFFILGTATTKLGYAQKAAIAIAQEKGGRRGAKNALAKVTVPALCALFAATSSARPLFLLAFAAALATATADTVASEIGKLWGRRTFLITTFRAVPRGTEGAVSLEGTVAGILAALAVAVLAYAVRLLPAAEVGIVVLAAFLATSLESLIGATVEAHGLLDNESVNFLATLAGALCAVGLAVAFA